MRPADYHMHTPLCHHATGTPVDYARVAIERGLDEIGFADHNPMATQFDDWRMSLADLPRYLELVAEAREKFPQLTIRLGLECDFIAGHESWIGELAAMADWDYLIGSVHYLPGGFEVDHPRHMSRHMGGERDELWAGYWKTYERCIRSGLFDFVAHPDLPKKFGFKPEGDLRRFYEPSVRALAECGVAFEINTAGLRKECREMYPAREFLDLAHAADVPLLINSDAHAPEEVGADFDAAIALARDAGYRELVRFERRRRVSVPL